MSQLIRTITAEIPDDWAGRTVGSYLREQLQMSEKLITRMKWNHAILRNALPVRLADTLSPGDRLTLSMDGQLRDDHSGCGLDIRFEDQDLLILNKPANLAPHGDRSRGDPTVASLLGDLVFYPINRLDRGTSGLMAAAKNPYMTDRLRNLLHTDAFVREYLAITAGIPSPAAGRIDLPILQPGEQRKRVISPQGQSAATLYEVMAVNDGLALVHIRLLTGRTHQIRVHFSAIGCPLLGDWLYGTPDDRIDRPALHSHRLCLRHPLTGKWLEVLADPPEDFVQFRLF